MNNVKQIRVIAKALTKQKERYLFEVAKINSTIKTKQSLIDKMNSYLKEYVAEGNLTMSKMNARLLSNFDLFLEQIQGVIVKTENEIKDLIKMRDMVYQKIQKADGKINLMENFEDKIKKNMLDKTTKSEQLTIDDIAVVKHMRSLYE